MAVVRGQRTTQNVTADIKVRDISAEITKLRPDRTPFLRFSEKLGLKGSKAMSYEHCERDMLSKSIQVNGAIASTSTATVVFDDTSYVKVNTLMYSVSTSEYFIVLTNNTSTNTLTVTRGALSSTAVNIGDNDVWVMAGEGAEEGVAFSDAITPVNTVYLNYLQEFETPVEMSWIQRHTGEYTNPDWDEMRTQAGMEHREKIETTMLLGRKGLTTGANGKRLFFSGGVKYWIDTNGSSQVSTVTGQMTYKKLFDWLKLIYPYGVKSQKILYASPSGRGVLSGIASSQVETQRTDNGLGVNIDTIYINGNAVRVLEHQMMADWGLDSTIFCIDHSQVVMRNLSANGRAFNTAWIPNVQANDLKGQKDVMYSIMGLHIKNAKAHGYITGFST